jgi:L-gulonolactone oxidase
VELTLVGPACGTIRLDASHPAFSFCKLGLGLLGVVADYTVKCVPVFHMKQIKKVHPIEAVSQADFSKMVMENLQCKFMWIPHENKGEFF